ncbi:MAG: MiaB/RimO family radical SAM methylthiotransferase [Candidatus Omnitrophota bacterium]
MRADLSPSFKGERVNIISLGCSRNLVDSEKILGDIKRLGATITAVEKATVVFLNTCAFTQDAKKQSLEAIFDLIDLKKKRKIKKIFVCGCLVKRYPSILKDSFKEVDGFMGLADFKKIFDPETRLTPYHFAYLKISEGCTNCCSFCAIPAIKGPLRSRKISAILDEVRFLEDQGVAELNIVGQDTTLYGMDLQKSSFSSKNKKLRGAGLVNLVEKILKVSRIPWVRLLYLHPLGVSKDLMDLIASQKRVCSYVDLPLQHINDRILSLMNRGVSREFIVRLIEQIRKRIPDITLRTTFIVGFPSETKKEFLELMNFVKVVRFDKLGVLAYSREDGTRAYNFKKQLVEEVKKRRYDTLMSLQRDISSDILKFFQGKIVDVLVDEKKKSGSSCAYVGRMQTDAPEADGNVFLRAKKPISVGSIVKARIIKSYEYDVEGEVIE